ncbi:galactosylceramide sulfotransferase-like [Patella vulgata]|uniref:galactosylceramide sulfotransferase-like n=1 Tax=Patella vulgata TaxID=6465 RepID=UPI0021803849|nr:galactosylceramide sulfotransferase-like [Patella vulgata]
MRKRRVLMLFLTTLCLLCFYLLSLLYVDIETDNSKSDFILERDINRNLYVDSPIERDPMCKPQDNFTFIKCMKCGTETLGTVFRRYGFVRNLTFVLPVEKRLYLGWPYQMETYDYRPSKLGFNILVEHAIYNNTIMRKIMPSDNKFITMIREPFNHFVSTFYYFRIHNITKMTSKEPITEYLHNIDKYETIYKSHQASKTRYCIPDGFSITKNLLSHCLGFPLGFPDGQQNIASDPQAVAEYITKLEKEFSLVMIMDYYDESLILLKQEFCWSFKDILYWTQNKGSYGNVQLLKTPENLHLHKEYDFLDYQLFDHFNKTFWRKVEEYPGNFVDEVRMFQQIKLDITRFCFTNDVYSTKVFEVTNNLYTDDFEFEAKECPSLRYYLLEKLRDINDKYVGKNGVKVSKLSKALC